MTQLEAINKAFIMLGAAVQNSLSANVHAMRVAMRAFESSKRSVISEFPWNFALRILQLTPGGFVPPSWLYSYSYPVNALVLWDVYREQGQGTVHWEVYDRDIEKLKYETNGVVIYTNYTPACCEYAMDLSIEEFPVMLADAVVYRLAGDMAMALTGSENMSRSMLQKYMAAIRAAKADSLNHRNDRRVQLGLGAGQQEQGGERE